MDLLTGFIPSNINCFTDLNPSKGDEGVSSYMYIMPQDLLIKF